MSRWLQANYKRKAVDATPQHENIEKQWEAEQWQKELNKPGIEYKLKKEETPKYFIDNISPTHNWLDDDMNKLSEDIVEELKQRSDRLEEYHKYLNSADYDKKKFINMLISDAKSFKLDTRYIDRTSNKFTSDNYKQYVIAQLEAAVFNKINDLPSPMKERVQEAYDDLVKLASLSQDPVTYIFMVMLMLLGAGVIGYITIAAIMKEAANHFKKDK